MTEFFGPSDGERFVGRATELVAARATIAAAASEDAGLVWIEGEAGAGKTALVAKATAELAAAGSVLRMAADEHTEDRPFWVTQQVGVGQALTGPAHPGGQHPGPTG